MHGDENDFDPVLDAIEDDEVDEFGEPIHPGKLDFGDEDLDFDPETEGI